MAFGQASDLVDTDPLLGALTAEGATHVHPLMANSPAIDAGSCTDANANPPPPTSARAARKARL
ncbi:MAG: hypothetical protein IPL28_22510 [Chloroflexi bacterium]|nr:hypothetical protein [Chloroflexota bacterium]